MTTDSSSRVGLGGVFDLLLGLVANVTVLLGVVAWGWPPGNVWIAFWLESVSVGVTTGLRLFRLGPKSTLMSPTFWALWYGGFTLVQGVFVAITAWLTGVRPDVTLAVPVALVLVRGAAEALSILAAPANGRPWLLVGPITRMLVLHVGVILGFGLALSAAADASLASPVLRMGPWTLTGAAAPLAILMAVKTLAELGVAGAWAARTALREREPGRDAS